MIKETPLINYCWAYAV